MAMSVELVPARLVHTGPIASRMRCVDRLECEALGRSPKDALRWGIAQSLEAYTALRDGFPIAIIGVVPVALWNGRGTIWMLGTDDVFRSGKALLKFGPHLINMWLETFEVLENVISIDNAPALNLLQRLGFTVAPCDVQRHGCIDFIPFWIERKQEAYA
jgi:ribosomal protein S18 acetylase RimI-like enzyme